MLAVGGFEPPLSLYGAKVLGHCDGHDERCNYHLYYTARKSKVFSLGSLDKENQFNDTPYH